MRIADFFICCALTSSCALIASAADDSSAISQFVNNHCADCHGESDPEGDLTLIGLDTFDANNAMLWQRVLTQLATGEMPPDSEERPPLEDREAVIEWIIDSMNEAGIEPSIPGGPLPQDGNLVDHERLFSGKFAGPASSPPRFWRRSQSQYDALMEQLWVIPKLRYEKTHQRTDPKWAAYSYSQPFPALDPTHFTNFSGSVHADEAALRALMDAGSQIAERLTSDETSYAPEIQPPIALGLPFYRRGDEWERFKLEPPPRPTEFQPFLPEKDNGALANAPTEAEQQAAVRRCFQLFLDRLPSDNEVVRYTGLLQKNMTQAGSESALRGLIVAVVVSPEFVFRMEVGMSDPDEFGRRMLSPNELVYAIAYALTDDGPDEALWAAARSGRLQTKADAEREVRRLLADDSIEKQRKLRFFQEFFGYTQSIDVFKDDEGWPRQAIYLVRDADMFVEHALQQDKHVFEELLTGDRYIVATPYFHSPEIREAIIERTIAETKEGIERERSQGREDNIKPREDKEYNRMYAYLQGRTLIPRTVHNDPWIGYEVNYLTYYGIDGNTFDWPDGKPIQLPGRRAGILTHPAWLSTYSKMEDNDIVRRGHWVREHLLAGKIPPVPLDVDARVPDEPESTLRQRMRVTQEDRCIRCHQRMDPLGYAFEIYDDRGRYREQEMVGLSKHKHTPKEIDASGAIVASGDPALDGKVDDAIDLVHKLAKSPRVRQSIIRHAFRYWMGRNEVLSDSPTLIAADKTYVDNEGSFNELLVSLLTSDSFLYRK